MIRIDPDATTPPYEQLRAQLAAQMVDRTLVVGARLPTVRSLAADLGLAVNTVARAYRELEEAGLVETRGRGGTFVSAAGGSSRARAQAAARTYAETVRASGLSADEGLRIAAAALGLTAPGSS